MHHFCFLMLGLIIRSHALIAKSSQAQLVSSIPTHNSEPQQDAKPRRSAHDKSSQLSPVARLSLRIENQTERWLGLFFFYVTPTI